ncbi:hypothetical protein Desku_3214 [Desulfofundulus kuznetsovii DSM 6115]|uniref:DUF488 domain-containing protein n=2 Tax=Desulfofundulus kuznetsovii TaxID=58135 RepID=A0AAU8PZB7_DESK7|nr:hypothetical protein Desku_3214 [Desulfofundulus kuznetsovii DSM 6115]
MNSCRANEQTKERVVYTIGHSNHTLSHFLGLLWKYGIEVVADIRSQPYSRYVPHFNQKKLERVLTRSGIKYLYLGKELGGRPKEPEFYDEGGIVNYSRMAESEPFQRGMACLIEELSKYRVTLMCGEEDPTMCHRRLLVGRALAGQGITVYHIRGDGQLETEAQLKAEKKVEGRKFQQLSLF